MSNRTPACYLDRIVGLNLQEHRKAAGITQHQLGAMINVTAQQISKFELGTNRISSIQLVELAKACNVNVADLLFGVADNFPTSTSLDNFDIQMMESYRALPEEMQASVRLFIAALATELSNKLSVKK